MNTPASEKGTPLIAPEFIQRMNQRQAQAQKGYIQMNKLYQDNNKVSKTTLNDWQY
ncbi:hypothetical protein [Chitinophaga sp. CF418]|uniref:hypothetical protein n=1 Tax=Chitinophaga sp. CF418 TaxID=1855287 RepID=UPI00165F7898|nr:hypothetical protein [Chitinophaga sp. CF418]